MTRVPLSYYDQDNIYIHEKIMTHRGLTSEDKILYAGICLKNTKGKATFTLQQLRGLIADKNPLISLEKLLKYHIIRSYYRAGDTVQIIFNDWAEDMIDG